MRTNSACGSPGQQEPFPKLRQQGITTDPFLHRTKKDFLTNIQNVTTSSEHPTTAVLVELDSAIKEEAMCQLIQPDNSRAVSAGFDQLRFTDGPHDTLPLTNQQKRYFFLLI